jgi:hypothetical protein
MKKKTLIEQYNENVELLIFRRCDTEIDLYLDGCSEKQEYIDSMKDLQKLRRKFLRK